MHVQPSDALPKIMFARYYGTSLGRFLSADLGVDTNVFLPKSFNRYSYVRNDPINSVDPNGKETYRVNTVMKWFDRDYPPTDSWFAHDILAVTDQSGTVTHTASWTSTGNPSWDISNPRDRARAQIAINTGLATLEAGPELDPYVIAAMMMTQGGSVREFWDELSWLAAGSCRGACNALLYQAYVLWWTDQTEGAPVPTVRTFECYGEQCRPDPEDLEDDGESGNGGPNEYGVDPDGPYGPIPHPCAGKLLCN